MPYNPLEDACYQKTEVGALVRVTGHVDKSFFEGRELVDETVIKLVD